MFHFKYCDIRLLQKRGEEVGIGEIYDDGLFVSPMILVKEPSGEFRIDTKFASLVVNHGHPEWPVDEETIRQEREALANFLLRHQDRFLGSLPAA